MMKKVVCLAAVVSVLICLLLMASAEQPVRFEDVNLRRAVNHALGDPGDRNGWLARIFRSVPGINAGGKEYHPRPSEMLTLEVLSANDLKSVVLHLGGIEYAANLTKLEFDRQHIRDISALSKLANLRELSLSHNRIEDVSALAGLTNLKMLYLHAQ